MIDVSRPNGARVYNYLLGGKDHFPADRQAAARVLDCDPEASRRARLNRAFVTRAARRAADAGITQFLDLGAGLPIRPSVDEVTRAVRQRTRVAYVDSDPVVFSHASSATHGRQGVTAVLADVRDPTAVLAAPGVQEVIRPGEPAGLILAGVAPLLPRAQVTELISGYLRAVAPGSWLIFSTEHAVAGLHARLAAAYGAGQFHSHGPADVSSFFRGLGLVVPGVAEARRWLTGHGGVPAGQPASLLCAAGVKPLP